MPNCPKCNQAQKEIFLLTSSVWECQNRLCSTPEQNGSGQPKVGENPYIDAKDGVTTWTAAWYCMACSQQYTDPKQHQCLKPRTGYQAPTVKTSVAPLHLQNWRTLDEIYKEVGSFPFTVQATNNYIVQQSFRPGRYDLVDIDDATKKFPDWDGTGKIWKLVSVP